MRHQRCDCLYCYVVGPEARRRHLDEIAEALAEEIASMVVAKFFVAEKTFHAGSDEGCGSVTLRAVSRGEENKQWSKFTPSGEIKMSILNPDALKALELGEEYIVSFDHSPKPTQ